MPFKIVETIERGRRLIETVPSSWECDGNLYWPRKNFISLKKNEESTPCPDWKCLSCILLRDNILDYKSAELEVALMSDATDTDDKENENPRKKVLVGLDYNNLVMECIQNNVGEKVTPTVIAEEASPMVTAEDTSSVIVIEPNTNIPMGFNNLTIQDLSQINARNPSEIAVIHDNILKPDGNFLLPSSDERLNPQISEPQTTVTDSLSVPQQIGCLIELVSTVQENQKVIFGTLQNILKTVALSNTKFEEFMARSQGSIRHEPHEESSSFKTINNIEELTAFEEQLKNPIRESKYLRELSITCSDKKTGHNNAYALIDVMFDRNLMTRCSWGGGTKGEPKHCFKAFTNTINLFLKVIHQYDKTFTKPICEEFLKNVMRHSVKRNLAKRVRNSTTKKKTKRSKTENNVQEHVVEAGARSSNDS